MTGMDGSVEIQGVFRTFGEGPRPCVPSMA